MGRKGAPATGRFFPRFFISFKMSTTDVLDELFHFYPTKTTTANTTMTSTHSESPASGNGGGSSIHRPLHRYHRHSSPLVQKATTTTTTAKTTGDPAQANVGSLPPPTIHDVRTQNYRHTEPSNHRQHQQQQHQQQQQQKYLQQYPVPDLDWMQWMLLDEELRTLKQQPQQLQLDSNNLPPSISYLPTPSPSVQVEALMASLSTAAAASIEPGPTEQQLLTHDELVALFRQPTIATINGTSAISTSTKYNPAISVNIASKDRGWTREGESAVLMNVDETAPPFFALPSGGLADVYVAPAAYADFPVGDSIPMAGVNPRFIQPSSSMTPPSTKVHARQSAPNSLR